MVPEPCLAVLMLFPITASTEQAKADGESGLLSGLWLLG